MKVSAPVTWTRASTKYPTRRVARPFAFFLLAYAHDKIIPLQYVNEDLLDLSGALCSGSTGTPG